MLCLFNRGRTPTSRPAVRWTRLALEGLETRDVPSATLNIAYGSGHTVILSGQVTDPTNSAGLVVTFGGAASGQATTDANGVYQVSLTATQLGVINAHVTETDGTQDSMQVYVQNSTPTITNLTSVQSANNIWTISGRVLDEFAQGLVVTFSAASSLINGRTATVAADGTFSLTVQLHGPADTGNVGVQVMSDWWGAASSVLYTYVAWSPSKNFR